MTAGAAPSRRPPRGRSLAAAWALACLALPAASACCRPAKGGASKREAAAAARAPSRPVARPVGARAAAPRRTVKAGAGPEKCREIARRADTVLAESRGQCQTDADCGCFAPGAPSLGCGGISDKGTVDRLNQLTHELSAQKCSAAPACGVWSCVPACRAGHCVNNNPDGRVLP